MELEASLPPREPQVLVQLAWGGRKETVSHYAPTYPSRKRSEKIAAGDWKATRAQKHKGKANASPSCDSYSGPAREHGLAGHNLPMVWLHFLVPSVENLEALPFE